MEAMENRLQMKGKRFLSQITKGENIVIKSIYFLNNNKKIQAIILKSPEDRNHGQLLFM